MSEQLDLALPPGTDSQITWERHSQVVGARYLMLIGGVPNGWMVAHCGHQTAIRPYYVDGPNGEHFQAYRLLDKAKSVAIERAGES